MITRSKDFDLGRDSTRIKDPKDAARRSQRWSLLDRFFTPRSTQRFEIQILADEVGMGKTFVALGLAYSILAHLKQARIEPDLEGCYQRVLVLTPNNHALYANGFVKSRSLNVAASFPNINLTISLSRLSRWNGWNLAVALRKPGRQPQVIVARMGLLRRRQASQL